MGKFKVGDRVIITAGAFKGERGAIVRKIRIGQGLRVALDPAASFLPLHR